MAIASASTLVKFHEFPSGNILHNYQPATQIDGPIRSISWSKDGNWLALVPNAGLAEIVSVKDQLKLIHTIHGIEEPSCACFQNTTKKNIAVGTKSGQVLVYDIKSRSVKKRFPRATSEVTRVDFTAKDGHLVAACEGGEAYLYSTVQNSLSGTFKIPRSQTISALRTNPIKRNYVVAGSSEGVVAVWDIHSNKNKFFIGSHKAPVTAVAFSPISSDLVVSAGLDRQFCFYDIGSNKCIGNIFVENSMTSVDFSPDGKFVVAASQKGKIYIYDSKHIQQPVYSFFGHNGPVEHLSFRKCEDYESSFSLGCDDKESVLSEDIQRNNESFPHDTMVYSESAKSTTSHESPAAEDSFMVAMGLEQNNSAESLTQSSRVSGTSKKFFMQHKYTPTNSAKFLQERIQSDVKAPLTSTPDFLAHDSFPQISPIVNLASQTATDQQRPCVDDLDELVKSTVKEELRIVSGELKNDMKYYSTHILAQTRQMFLDLLMSMVKESIKVENSFNSLRQELVSEVPPNQNSLFEENLMLKEKIAVLEEELAVLRNNQVNQNF